MQSRRSNARFARTIAVAMLSIVAHLTILHPASAQRVLGVDISAHQGNVSQSTWTNNIAGAGRSFAIIRSTRGGTTGEDHRQGGYSAGDTSFYNLSQRYDDPYFVQNMNFATNAGLFAGFYQRTRADILANTLNSDGVTTAGVANNGTDEGAHIVQMAGAFMRPGYMLPVMDFEDGQTSRTPDQLAQFAIQFSNKIYSTMGIRPMMYINGTWSSTLQSVSNSANADPSLAFLRDQLAKPATNTPSVTGPAFPALWNARYDLSANIQTANPKDTASTFYGPWDDYGDSQPWDFWQHSSSGTITNIIGAVDLDVSHGDIENLKDFLIPALWMNDSSGDWSSLGNWNSGQTPVAPIQAAGQLTPIGTQTLPTPRLPGAAGSGPTSGQYDTVILERPNADITVTFSTGSINIRKLYMRETLNITGGSLTINYDPNYASDTVNYPNALRSGPISAQFSGPVTLSGTGSLSVNTLQVDAGQTFTWAGSAGALTFRQINLMPSATTPANIAVTGDVNINPLNDSTAAISRGSGTGNSGGLNLIGGVRAFNVGNGSAVVDLDVAVPITNGGLTKNGAGTMRLSAANTFSGGVTLNTGSLLMDGANTVGAVTVNGGTLGGTGSVSGGVAVNNAAHLAPGDGGVGTFGVGSLTLNAGSVLNFEFGVGGTADRIDVAGLLTLGSSALSLSDLGGLGFGTYALIHYGTLSGNVADMSVSAGASNFGYKLVDTGSAINLLVTLPGDFNGDGVVDMSDYPVWRAGLGTVYTDNDYATWRAHFGQVAASGSELTHGSAVPEPTACLLLACAVVILVGTRRG